MVKNILIEALTPKTFKMIKSKKIPNNFRLSIFWTNKSAYREMKTKGFQFLNGPSPASFLFVLILYKHFTEWLQRDSNMYHQSRKHPSELVWPDRVLNFGHIQKWKFDQQQNQFVKVGSKFCQIPTKKSKSLSKDFKISSDLTELILFAK